MYLVSVPSWYQCYLRVFVVAPAGARQFVRVADTRFGRGHDGEIITGRATDGSLPRIEASVPFAYLSSSRFAVLLTAITEFPLEEMPWPDGHSHGPPPKCPVVLLLMKDCAI